MTKDERIIKKIEADSVVIANINNESYYNTKSFIKDCKAYIKAVKDGRILCNIEHVSSSGATRHMSFHSCEKSTHGHYYRQYLMAFKVLGFNVPDNKYYVKIFGGGMDMVFGTNYNMINKLHKLGFITQKECSTLCQKTPTVL